ncbi:MAG: hypothetical protein ABWX96_06320 [Propionibacteriaceae bacterium]
MAQKPSREPRDPADPPQPLLGSAPTTRTSRWAGFSVTKPRVAVVVAIVALVLLGSLLPYLTMPYINTSSELTTIHTSLFGAVNFMGGFEALWLPDYSPGPQNGAIQVAINVFNAGVDVQQVGLFVAVITCGSLFQNEINKFFWWPLHLSGWALALSPLPLLIGLRLFHQAGVDITLHAGWVPIAVAGVVILVATFQARNRIDTYASI